MQVRLFWACPSAAVRFFPSSSFLVYEGLGGFFCSLVRPSLQGYPFLPSSSFLGFEGLVFFSSPVRPSLQGYQFLPSSSFLGSEGLVFFSSLVRPSLHGIRFFHPTLLGIPGNSLAPLTPSPPALRPAASDNTSHTLSVVGEPDSAVEEWLSEASCAPSVQAQTSKKRMIPPDLHTTSVFFLRYNARSDCSPNV